MAQHRLSNTTEAKKWLAMARESESAVERWSERTKVELLRQEAGKWIR